MINFGEIVKLGHENKMTYKEITDSEFVGELIEAYIENKGEEEFTESELKSLRTPKHGIHVVQSRLLLPYAYDKVKERLPGLEAMIKAESGIDVTGELSAQVVEGHNGSADTILISSNDLHGKLSPIGRSIFKEIFICTWGGGQDGKYLKNFWIISWNSKSFSYL